MLNKFSYQLYYVYFLIIYMPKISKYFRELNSLTKYLTKPFTTKFKE